MALITCIIVCLCAVLNVINEDKHARSFAVFVGNFALFIGNLLLYLQFSFGSDYYNILCAFCHNCCLRLCVVRKAYNLQRKDLETDGGFEI